MTKQMSPDIQSLIDLIDSTDDSSFPPQTSGGSFGNIASSTDALAVKPKVITCEMAKHPSDARRQCTVCSQQVSLALSDTETGGEFFIHCTVEQHYCPESACGIVFRSEDDYDRHYLQEHYTQVPEV